MKKFAKIVLALVLAVALVLPLMPVAKADVQNPDPEAKSKKVTTAFDYDNESLNKLGDEKIAAVQEEMKQEPASVELEIAEPGLSVEYQVKKGVEGLEGYIKNLANAAGVPVTYTVPEKYADLEAGGKVKIHVVFGKVEAKPGEKPAEEKPGKIDGYYQFRPYFVNGKNFCKMVRDWGESDVQDMFDKLNAHANWYKVNNVPDVDMVAEHINMHGYELLAKEFNDEYGYISYRFGNPFSLVDWKEGKVKFEARIPEIADEAIKNADDQIKVHNGVYYVPVYVDYNLKKYEVCWKIVPNETSLEKSMGYWPGRDITEKYDRLVDGNPFKAELWAIENIGKVDSCSSKVLFPMPDYRTHDKAGLWFYAPVVAPKAVKVKDSDPAKYEVNFEYIFAGTAEYERVYKNPALKAEAKPADTKVAVKPAKNQSNNPGTGDVMVLSYLVSGIAAAGAYVATKHNR